MKSYLFVIGILIIAFSAISTTSPASVVNVENPVITLVDDSTAVQAKSCVPDKECVPTDCKTACAKENCSKDNCQKADPKCCKEAGTKKKCCTGPKKK